MHLIDTDSISDKETVVVSNNKSRFSTVCSHNRNVLIGLTVQISVQRAPKHGTRYTKRYVEFRLANDDSINKLYAGTLIDKLHKLVALVEEVVAHNT